MSQILEPPEMKRIYDRKVLQNLQHPKNSFPTHAVLKSGLAGKNMFSAKFHGRIVTIKALMVS